KKNNISSIISGSYQFEALNKGNIIQKFWHKEKNLIAKKILKKYNSYFVLDAGSGAGNFFYINKNDFKIISIDKNFYSCLFIKKNGGKSIQCDLCYLPFKKNIFDTIVSQDVIEHLNNIQSDKMMDEFLKILKNEGLIFIVTPNYSSIWILVEKAVDLFNLLPSLEQQHFQKFNIPFLEKLKKQSLIKLETGSFFLLSPILSIFSYNIASKFSIFELKKIRFGALCYIVFKNKISDSIKNSIINNNN
ncbi:class I SAM-dependent methyltransferase, partial [Candidatus Dependentiae bacterium]|nr:class I SAM-dependent methyltransferase [Candidatus Dependentiae bacterium]